MQQKPKWLATDSSTVMEDDQIHIVGICEYHGCEFTHFVAEICTFKIFIVSYVKF